MNIRLRHAVRQVVWHGGSVVRLLGLVMVFITGYAKSVRIILVRSLIGRESSVLRHVLNWCDEIRQATSLFF
jgi:hypothetical protein